MKSKANLASKMMVKYWLELVGVIVGAAGGLLYWKYVGCSSGTCPITSSPVLSALFGALLGFLIFSMFKKGKSTDNKSNNIKTEKAMKTVELTKSDFLTKVADFETNPQTWKYLGDKPAIVDFYATWCGPCKSIAPVLEDLAAEYEGKIHVYKIDVDKEQNLASAFNVRSIPTLLFIPVDGKPQMAQGAMSKSDFKKLIDEFLLKEGK